MPPLYRIIEIAIYSLLNFTPYIIIALYPFKHKFRFSTPITINLIILVSIIQVFLGIWAAFFSGHYIAIVSLVSTLIYFIFYFSTVKTHLGKTLFTLLMLSNIGNLVVMLSKCIEGMIFPEYAYQSYRWTFSLIMIFVEIIILIPLFFYFKNTYSDIFEKDTAKSTWRFLWLIPATFYVVWYYQLYASTLSSLEIALSTSNSMFLIAINLGAFLIYHTVVKLIREVDKNLQLYEVNHHLMMQNLQYDNLQSKINEARIAKHDVKQHISIINGYVQKQEYQKLQEYLNSYHRSLPDDSTIVYCEKQSVNMLLLYFVEQCKNNNIEVSINTVIPEDINIPDNDLSVLLGNLFENAIEACLTLNSYKKIILKARLDNRSLFITMDNTFDGKLKTDKNNHYLSTKKNGSGLGLLSIKNTVERYNGLLLIDPSNQVFKVSVMLNFPIKE